MFKVLEVHSRYISSGLAIILHGIILVYILYILKTTAIDYRTKGADKKVVWYQQPAKKATPPAPAVYKEPEQAAQAPTQGQVPVQHDEPIQTEPALASPVEQPIAPNPLRKLRSAQERRSAWTKPPAAPTQEPQKMTAGMLMDAISQQEALKRQAHAVYTKEQAIKEGIAAQMREITQERLRHKIFSAMQMAFDMHKKEYFSPVPIKSTINVSVVINQKGEIVAIEVLKSSGTQSLDEHIVSIIQTIKKIATPPSRNNQEFFTVTFAGNVTIHAGSGHIIFDYQNASGIHVV